MFGKRKPDAPRVAVNLDPLTAMRADLNRFARAEGCVFIGSTQNGSLEIYCIASPMKMRRAVSEARSLCTRHGVDATVLEKGETPSALLRYLAETGWVAGDRRTGRR